MPFVNLMETFNDLTCFVTGAQLSSSFRKAAILNYVHPKLASLLYVIQGGALFKYTFDDC